MPVNGGEAQVFIQQQTSGTLRWSSDKSDLYYSIVNGDQNIWSSSLSDIDVARPLTDLSGKMGSLLTGGFFDISKKYIFFCWQEPPRSDIWVMDVTWE
jgi:hypothetical protein